MTLGEAWQGGLAWSEAPGYLSAQVGGALLGVAVAHLMFGEPLFSLSRHVRQGPGQLLSEFVATFGLVSVIGGCARHRPSAVPFAVGAYIAAAYWFTASTSFANPAVTLARVGQRHVRWESARPTSRASSPRRFSAGRPRRWTSDGSSRATRCGR